MAKQAILIQKPARITNGKLLTDQPLLDRGMNLDECRSICTSPKIPVREKLVSLHAWLCIKLAKGITTMQVGVRKLSAVGCKAYDAGQGATL